MTCERLSKPLISQKNSIVLDLTGQGVTEKDIPQLLEFIARNPQLEEVYLPNNDLREEIIQLLIALRQCPKLRVLDIVDNNIEQLKTWEIVANFIATSPKLEEIYIGAKMIMGSTNGRHTVVDYDQKTGGYHNTWWDSGYYGTGFNEMEHTGLHEIERAIAKREAEHNPLQAYHLLSTGRSTIEIAKRKGAYTFDRAKNTRLFSYTREFYSGDAYIKDLHLSGAAPRMRM